MIALVTSKVIYEDNDSIMFSEVMSFLFVWEQGEYLWNLYIKESMCMMIFRANKQCVTLQNQNNHDLKIVYA